MDRAAAASLRRGSKTLRRISGWEAKIASSSSAAAAVSAASKPRVVATTICAARRPLVTTAPTRTGSNLNANANPPPAPPPAFRCSAPARWRGYSSSPSPSPSPSASSSLSATNTQANPPSPPSPEGKATEAAQAQQQQQQQQPELQGPPPAHLSAKEQQIWELLRRGLGGCTRLEVADISGGCGSMYGIEVVSARFRGLGLLKQQRLVNEVLGEEVKGWHGLQLKTRAP